MEFDPAEDIDLVRDLENYGMYLTYFIFALKQYFTTANSW